MGSLGDSLAALLSSNRQPGFMGGVQTFLNPYPTLAQDAGQRAQQALNEAAQATMPTQMAMLQALDAGDRQQASSLLAQVMDEYQKRGLPVEPIAEKYALKAQESDKAGIRRQDLSAPNATLGLGQFSNFPEQSAALIRSNALNQGTQADTARTQQTTDQAGQLFPDQQALLRAQVGTQGAQQEHLGAETAYAGTQNQMEQERLNYLREHGMLPGTAGAGRTPALPGFPDLSNFQASQAAKLRDAYGKETGAQQGIQQMNALAQKVDPTNPEDVNNLLITFTRAANSFDPSAAKGRFTQAEVNMMQKARSAPDALSSWWSRMVGGVPLSRGQIDEMKGVLQKMSETAQEQQGTIRDTYQAHAQSLGIPEELVFGQGAGAAPAMPAAKPPNPRQAAAQPSSTQPPRLQEFSLDQVRNMSDKQMGTLHIEEQTLRDLFDQHRQILGPIFAEFEAKKAKTPKSGQAALQAQYQRRFIDALAAGQ